MTFREINLLTFQVTVT